ncbi:MFS transporter [Halorubrum sp. AD140]|uniref:MFS transporter n=1 Tax=Halorubrum sp. AD140 TaxID=3050073 RepID=UPI002ACC6D0C|nr:MFS transporter [Halorubrum sp. AD140]MDZ5811531.1 MFS transporter [Halorubrum sp. AD140]
MREYDVLIFLSSVWFVGKFVRYTIPPLFEALQATYAISNATVGAAFTGFMAVYALMQFPSGVVADWLGSVSVVVTGATVAGLGMLALAVDASFEFFVAAMLIVGAGTGVHKTVAVRLVARTYPNRTGRTLGIHDTVGAFGGVVAPTAVVVFLSTPLALTRALSGIINAEWRGIFLLSGFAALGLAGAFTHWFRNGSTDGTGRSVGDQSDDFDPNTEGPVRAGTDSIAAASVQSYLRIFLNGRFTTFVLVVIGVSFAYNGVIAFLPLYLTRVTGRSPAVASLLYSVFFWTTFVQLLSGECSDRFGRFPVLVVTSGTAAVALCTFLFLPEADTITLGVLIALIGAGANGFNPVRGAHLMAILPERLSGGGLGVVRSLLMGTGALAPAVVGVLIDISDFRVAFGLLAAASVVSALGVSALWATSNGDLGS